MLTIFEVKSKHQRKEDYLWNYLWGNKVVGMFEIEK